MGQVFRLQRERESLTQRSVEVVYGWTSLSLQRCSPQRLLQVFRALWMKGPRRRVPTPDTIGTLAFGCARRGVFSSGCDVAVMGERENLAHSADAIFQ